MIKRLVLALVAVLLPITALAVVEAPAAHAASIVWYVHYGDGVTGTSPNVWSNRVPTWNVGTNPHLTAQTDGNLVDYATFCPGGVCWASNTANVGPSPWQTWWDSRPVTSGDVRIYSSEGAIRWQTHTSGWSNAQMVFFDNGCLNVYGYGAGGWGAPIWSNSTSSACSISL